MFSTDALRMTGSASSLPVGRQPKSLAVCGGSIIGGFHFGAGARLMSNRHHSTHRNDGKRLGRLSTCVAISASFFFSPIFFLDEQKENGHRA
jgi:hypothetical protein